MAGTARMDKYLLDRRTYRVALSDLAFGTSAGGVAVELIGIDNGLVKLSHMQISKPSVAVTPLTLEKFNTATSSGTFTSPAPLRMKGSDSTASAVLRLYTVAPSTGSGEGSLDNQFQEIDVATTDVSNESYIDNSNGVQAPILTGSTESLIIRLARDVILNGYLEWTEEP